MPSSTEPEAWRSRSPELSMGDRDSWRIDKVDAEAKGMVTIIDARSEAVEGGRGRRFAEVEGCTGGIRYTLCHTHTRRS
ncbi:hypothetical protein L2E82_08043 [Cichorium intybus]|uniref:Uncharacterized protein n=1 Tax=Cichorium intybus TaxID=13427 RepID=A0ACB9G6K3_CICIN|nr:hypothetical protein L2E82_08043 [Cichorium intybus]